MKNKIEPVIIILMICLVVSLGYVIGTTLMAPPQIQGNYSTTMTFNCNTSLNTSATDYGSYNVSIYYNVSGGDANNTATLLTTVSNTSGLQESFNGSADISGLADGTSYNFSCYADNGTDQEVALGARAVRIDNTPPNVSAFNGGGAVGNATNNHNYSSGTLLFINFSADDTIMGVSSGWINISYANGTQISFNQTTNLGSIFYNYSLNTSNTTTFIDGFYNITAYANDTQLANLNNSESIYIALDSTVPAVTISTPANVNLSGTKTLNATVSDAVIGVEGVWFNITNATEGSGVSQLNFTKATNSGGTNYNISLDTSGFADGKYNLTIYANDSQVNNLNSTTKIQLMIDNSVPSGITFSCSPSQVYAGATVTCTCSGTDAFTDVNTTVFTASPSTTNTGSYEVTCTVKDYAGNELSGTFTYVVEQGGSSGSGGGGGGTTTQFYTKTISRLEQEFSEIKNIQEELREKQRVRVKIDDETHYVGVREVTATSITIEIASDPIQINLNIGEDAKVDVNDDGYYDIYVKLNSIINGYADLKIDYLHEEIPEPEEGEEVSTVETTGEIIEGEEPLEEETDLTWLWIVIGIVVVLVVVIVVWMFRKKSK